MKKLEFYEGEVAAKRFEQGMRVLITSKPLKKTKQVAQADSKALSERLDRS